MKNQNYTVNIFRKLSLNSYFCRNPYYLNKMKRYLLLLFFSLALVYLKAQSSVDTLRLSDYLSKIEQNGQCIGSLAIMKDGKNIYARRLGKDLLRNKQEIE